MIEQLQAVFSLLSPPTHAHVGEAFLLHESLAAYYYLRAKCTLFAAHSQTPELKDWFRDAIAAVNHRIDSVVELMDELGIPLPGSLPVSNDLTDQFMALDGAAMVKGMLSTDAIMLQSTLRADVAGLYVRMFSSTLDFGTRLKPIMEKEGWLIVPPAFNAESAQKH